MTQTLPGGLRLGGPLRPLGGGSICDVAAGRLADGRAVVVKRTPYPAPIEARGLRLLAAAGAPVPEVLAVDDTTLVLESVDGPEGWAGLGAAVAATHRTTGPAFGLDHDNRIGPLVQPGGWYDDWPTCYAQARLASHLPDLPADLASRIEAALPRVAEVLPADPPASLIHGDLWSGNIVAGRWLIDPAVSYADRELDLAFSRLFGGLPRAFYRGYDEAWPLADGWQAREPLLQLHHLLVHVRLFGGGYRRAVERRLDTLGW